MEGEIERDEAMRRERKGLEGDKLRERWKNKKKQGLGGGGGGCYAHVQLQLYRLKAGWKIFLPPLLSSSTPPPPPPHTHTHTHLTQAKNPTHRSQVQKAVKEGIKTPSLPSLHPLSQDFVDETLVLSDLLDLNELSAVELLLAGEQQQPR